MKHPVSPMLSAMDDERSGNMQEDEDSGPREEAPKNREGQGDEGSEEITMEDLACILEEGENLGERKPKVARRPLAPTKSEIEEHFPLHVHYRSWCPHCRAGKSLSKQHRMGKKEDKELGVTISLDYAFKAPEEAEDDLSPILIAYDNDKGAIWALEVEHKGVDSGVGVSWLVDRLEAAGYAGMKITIKSDQEPSILSVKNAVAVKRGCETALIESPVRESKSNGQVERAIRTWRDQYRTMRHYFEYRMKMKLDECGALSSWLTTWASEVLNKYKVQENGRTAYEMMTQHKCKHLIVGFGERVDFQHTATSKSGYKKDTGIFSGLLIGQGHT